MIAHVRKWYNDNFTVEKYNHFLASVSKEVNHNTPFRIAESPFFIPKILKDRLLEACEINNDVICSANLKQLTEGALIGNDVRVPNEDEHTTFLQMDYGITMDEEGQPMPKLIEIQGFPSVYFFQKYISQQYQKHFDIPSNFSVFFNGMSNDEYVAMMKRIIIGDTDPSQVVMLEIEPEKQTTYIDFICTEMDLGLKVLCMSKVIKHGRELFYLDTQGKEVKILKIYNRIIFDELDQRPDLERAFNFTDDLDIEWIGHPNWFYRISKYTMPLLSGKYVPQCYYLDQLEKYPANLEDFVLKPLYSFAGAGVELNVTKEMLDSLPNKANYLLQEKVEYYPVIQAPGEGVKCEVRMLMVWEKGEARPKIVNNLVRLSKGAMIGVKYNKDKDWVGGSVGFFEV